MDQYPDDWPPRDLGELTTFSSEEGSRLVALVESLDAALLDRIVEWSSDGGREYAPASVVLAHIVNHGTQHRSELARYLTECGYSPGDMDLL